MSFDYSENDEICSHIAAYTFQAEYQGSLTQSVVTAFKQKLFAASAVKVVLTENSETRPRSDANDEIPLATSLLN